MSIKQIMTKDGIGYLVKVKMKSKLYPKASPVVLQRTLVVSKKIEAQRTENQLREDARQRIKDLEHDGFSFGYILTKWYQIEILNGRSVTPTFKEYHDTLQIYAKSIFDIPICRINQGYIEDIYAEMKALGKSNSRMRTIRSGLNTLYEWGHKTKLIPRYIVSPAKGAKLPRDTAKKEQPILNLSEIQLFLDKAKECNHKLYHIWAVAFLTGMRSGELYALEWKDIDLESNLISVNKSFNGKTNTIKAPKNNKSRNVPINDDLKNLLSELKLLTYKSGMVLPRLEIWRRGEIAKVTREFCRMIGVREINFHATRACWAVQCLQAGVPQPIVMHIGGWHGLKAFQHYIRLSGLDITGATDNLSLIPKPKISAKVINLNL